MPSPKSYFDKFVLGTGTALIDHRACEQTRKSNECKLRLETVAQYKALKRGDITPHMYAYVRSAAGAKEQLVLSELDDWSRQLKRGKNKAYFLDAHNKFDLVFCENQKNGFVEFCAKKEKPIPFASVTFKRSRNKVKSSSVVIPKAELERVKAYFKECAEKEYLALEQQAKKEKQEQSSNRFFMLQDANPSSNRAIAFDDRQSNINCGLSILLLLLSLCSYIKRRKF